MEPSRSPVAARHGACVHASDRSHPEQVTTAIKGMHSGETIVIAEVKGR
jgi:hypothetical protein